MNLRWSTLKWLGRSKLVNSSFVWIVIVPILARALQSVPKEIPIPYSGTSFNLHLTLPFSWTRFYFAALFFSAALGIYYIWCPRIIRRYDDYGDYRSRHRGSYRLSEDFIRFLSIHTELWRDDVVDELGPLCRSFLATVNIDLAKLLKDIPQEERKVRRHYDEIVKHCAESEVARSDIFDFLAMYEDGKVRQPAFWASFSLFCVGLVLMTWVFGESLWAVVNMMW